jgi:excisionase family DNA binding protein
MDNSERLLTVRQAAQRLGVNQSTVRRWIHKRAIPYVEVGPYRRKKIKQSDVEHQVRSAGAA